MYYVLSMFHLVFDPLAIRNFIHIHVVLAKLPHSHYSICFRLINQFWKKNYLTNVTEIHKQGVVLMWPQIDYILTFVLLFLLPW